MNSFAAIASLIAASAFAASTNADNHRVKGAQTQAQKPAISTSQ